jgi:phenylacetate-CoA ligase
MIPDNLKTACFLLKYNLFNKAAVTYYHLLQKQQFMSPDEIESLNWEKRKRLLAYAYKNVPYYREKFDSVGLDPQDIKQPEDYSKVPLLRRDDIRANFDRLLSIEAKPGMTRISTTGGSTGEPLRVLFDKRVQLEALAWRIRDWWGVPLGVNEAVAVRMAKQRAIDRWFNSLIWLPALRVKLDASSMKSEDIETFITKFNRIRPQIVWGYVGAIDHVASFASDNHLDFVPPKAIWVTAAPLSEVQRKRIENTFHAPVYEQYGCCEIFALAAQCSQRRALHISHDARLIEFTDDSGRPQPTAELGNIVLTDLENYCFPLIRYMNGDTGRAVKGKCTCGINLPLMDKVKGRQTDIIRLPNGTCLAGEYLTTIFDNFPDSVKGFQVRQRQDYSIKIIYIPSSLSQELNQVLDRVRKDLLKRTQGQVRIDFEAVNNIPHDRGKLRYIISEIGSDCKREL